MEINGTRGAEEAEGALTAVRDKWLRLVCAVSFINLTHLYKEKKKKTAGGGDLETDESRMSLTLFFFSLPQGRGVCAAISPLFSRAR